jgi:radical SAM protein with 4Fe4S-binding SPASM domain
MAAIELSVRLGLRVRVTRVAMDMGSEDDLGEFISELERMGVSKLSINQFSPVMARHFESWQPRNPSDWLSVRRALENLAKTTTVSLSYEVGYVTPEEWPSFYTNETRCLIRRREWFVVRCDGEVFPCYHFFHRREMSLGNVQHSDITGILGHGNWTAYSGISKPPTACASCSFSESCHGGCPSPGYLRMGDLAVRDPRCNVESGFIPVCPFVKRTAGTSALTNIAPYYSRNTFVSDPSTRG